MNVEDYPWWCPVCACTPDPIEDMSCTPDYCWCEDNLEISQQWHALAEDYEK